MNSLTGKFYPLADDPSPAELAALGGTELVVSDKVGVKAVATGEKRKPCKGEWYLSGAVIEAYRAGNDLATEFYIARLVVT